MNNDVIGSNSNTSRPVAIWIGIGVVMLIVQVILGGVTRLTGSGLSITEWDVITGSLPPLSEQSWIREFDKYRQTPQFQLLNIDFTLSDFKFIYFWEWFHRLWARLIGVVFIIGFVYLSWKKLLAPQMKRPLIILFLLGALQGAVGWIMVMSGLEGDAVYVAPTRLALHFIFAFVLIAYALWFYLELVVPQNDQLISRRLNSLVGWTLLLIIIQLIFGALMAGHKGATAAPTWPDINGSFFPDATFRDTPFLFNFIENKVTIHFVHRNLAYVIFLLICILSVKLFRTKSPSKTFNQVKALPLVLVTVQVLLGIFSLVTSPRIVPNHWGAFEWLAQLHQVAGIVLALTFVALFYVVRRR
ncbi:MAG: COX15/CtaA family protein [Chitinophagaceae bacterium]|nr:COX15/CtaA family protein [Chitinophagaceae bacterium]